MIVLGIDSATRTASVGLVADGRLLAERSLPGARDLAATILPLIERTLAEAGRGIAEIDLVAVSSGPGSFTGLRIGVSIAKAVALSTGCSLVGVSSLEALAMTAVDGGESGARLICPVLDARRGEVYGALFRAAGGRLERLTDDRAMTAHQLVDELRRNRVSAEPWVLLGDGVEPYRATWEAIAEGIQLLSFALFHPRGAQVAELGARQVAVQGADRAAALVPRYCRVSEAEKKRQVS